MTAVQFTLLIINESFFSIDLWLKRIITRIDPKNIEDKKIDALTYYHFSSRKGVELEAIIIDCLNVLDGKTSALLTHISLMLAIMGLLYPSINFSGFFGFIVSVIYCLLVFLYILAAYLSLRCLRFWTFSSDESSERLGEYNGEYNKNNSKEELRRLKLELYFRSVLHRTSLNIASLSTIISLAIMMASKNHSSVN